MPKGQEGEASKAASFVFGDASEEVLRETRLRVAEQKRPGGAAAPAGGTALAVLLSARVLPATIAGLGCVILQQVSGQVARHSWPVGLWS